TRLGKKKMEVETSSIRNERWYKVDANAQALDLRQRGIAASVASSCLSAFVSLAPFDPVCKLNRVSSRQTRPDQDTLLQWCV
ncbi:MAG: hypothetical protein C0404_13525, partial [Verrucomicrobia bacterium]|nr:hypothetical protein [Verrucomicrobiota bacterium]